MNVELMQPALWVLSMGVVAVLVARGILAFRNSGRTGARTPLLQAALAAAVALLVVPAIGVVPAGHRGVVYDVTGGVKPAERGEGITLLAPWLQHMRNLSVRTQKLFSDKVYAQSLDLQEITVVASVNYRVDPSRAAELYRDVGVDYEAVTIQPALFQRTKAAVGKVKAEDFASNRASLATKVQAQLSTQLRGYGILVEYVNIEDAIFDKEFIAAVKAKVIAEQVVQEEQRLVKAEEFRKQQAVKQAQGRARSVFIEAQAQKGANIMLAQSLTPKLLRWKWLTTWNGILPTTLAGGSVALLLDGRGASDPFEPELFSPEEEDYEEEPSEGQE